MTASMNALRDPLSPYWRTKVEAASAAIDRELRGEVSPANSAALLSEQQREVVILVDGSGLSVAETAQRLGKSPQTVYGLLWRARAIMARGQLK